jgi:beta-lactam-binding protein with PASTA domain/tRNA A-37 threonylcarbamoyl transferase component Bud32
MIGRLVDGRYQVRSRIARGGMATVYLATDLRLERRVAIKVMHGHLADDSKFKERFIQEARSAARLAHPNVVNVFDQGQDSDMAYLVMEYLPGITLRDLLQDHGRLTTEQTLDILEAVLAGLSAAHKAGIVHRDLKPENVLLADDGRIKIGDFGLARAASANTATGAALLGTIAYLSPELVTRGIADTRSDIYAVGIMTYEMLTGEQPFKGEQPMQIAYQHANDSVPTPSTKNPRVPVELDELVLWSTARNPEERPRDARVMLDEVMGVAATLEAPAALAAATGTQRTMVLPGPVSTRAGTMETQVLNPPRHSTGPVPPTSTVDRLGEKSRKRRARGWWLFALVLILAALGGGTAWYFGSGPGAHVTVTDVRGMTVSAARAALTADGFTTSGTFGHRTDANIARGDVVATTPGAGADTTRGETITLIRSDGPANIALPKGLVGMEESAARSAITTAHFRTASDDIQQFSSKVEKGRVMDYLDANQQSLKGKTKYAEERQITLVVSAGPLPSVKNLSVPDAINLLRANGLTATTGRAIFSDDVDKGNVIEIDPQDGRIFRTGDSDVLLVTSKGPQMVAVPNVVGMNWADAKKMLLDLKFKLQYGPPVVDISPGSFHVTGTNPSAGTSVAKGSSITVYLALGG